MDTDPTRPISIELLRDRVLTDTILKLDGQKNVAPQQEARSLFNQASFVANKANILIEAIQKKAIEYSIPVHPEAEEVRAAVARKSSDSPDGSVISFDLFQDSLEVMYRRKKVITEMVISEGMGDPQAVLSKKILHLRTALTYPESATGLTAQDIAFMLSQFFILYLANRLLGPFEGKVHAEFVSLIPDGAAAEGMIGFQILESFIFQLIIFGINEGLLADWLDNAGTVTLPPGMSGRKLIEAAKARKLEPIHKMAQAYVGIDDYEKILNYAFEYIGRTSGSGFEMWIGYADSIDCRFMAQNLWTYSPVYSAAHSFDQISKSPRHRQNRNRTEDRDRDLFDIDLSDALKVSLIGMNQDYFNQEKLFLDGLSNKLDTIAQVLGSEFSLEALCCLARFLVHIPKDKLAILRAIMAVMVQSGADFYFLDLQSLLSRILNFNVFEVLAREAVYQAQKFFDRLAEKILGIFGDDLALLLCCPLIKDMIETLLRVLVNIENRMIDLIEQFAKSITLNLDGLKRRYLFLNDQRYVQQLMKVIDQVMKLLDALVICQETPTDDLIRQRIADDIRSMEVIPSIKIESGDAEKYFSTADAKEGNHKRIIPALGQPISLEARIAESIKARVDEISANSEQVIDTIEAIPGVAARSASTGLDNLLSELGIVKLNRAGGQLAFEDEKMPGLGLCYRLFSELEAKNAAAGL